MFIFVQQLQIHVVFISAVSLSAVRSQLFSGAVMAPNTHAVSSSNYVEKHRKSALHIGQVVMSCKDKCRICEAALEKHEKSEKGESTHHRNYKDPSSMADFIQRKSLAASFEWQDKLIVMDPQRCPAAIVRSMFLRATGWQSDTAAPIREGQIKVTIATTALRIVNHPEFQALNDKVKTLTSLDQATFDSKFGRYIWGGECTIDDELCYSGVKHVASGVHAEFPNKMKISHSDVFPDDDESGPVAPKSKLVHNGSSYGAKVSTESMGLQSISNYFEKSLFEPV